MSILFQNELDIIKNSRHAKQLLRIFLCGKKHVKDFFFNNFKKIFCKRVLHRALNSTNIQFAVHFINVYYPQYSKIELIISFFFLPRIICQKSFRANFYLIFFMAVGMTYLSRLQLSSCSKQLEISDDIEILPTLCKCNLNFVESMSHRGQTNTYSKSRICVGKKIHTYSCDIKVR